MLMFNNKTAFFIILSGLLLIAIGVMRGEFQDVLFKGINICLECMGLG